MPLPESTYTWQDILDARELGRRQGWEGGYAAALSFGTRLRAARDIAILATGTIIGLLAAVSLFTITRI